MTSGTTLLAPTPPTHAVTVDPFVFTGEKISLRKVTLQDCTDTYVSWLRDADVTRYLETRWHDQGAATVTAFVSHMANSTDSHLLAIIENYTSQHIGNIKIGPINSHHMSADISYFIGNKSYWGNGFATEAIKGAVKYAFSKLGLYSLRAGVYGKNVASLKALEKNGFKVRGTFPNELSTHGDARDDHTMLSITLPEYKSMLS